MSRGMVDITTEYAAKHIERARAAHDVPEAIAEAAQALFDVQKHMLEEIAELRDALSDGVRPADIDGIRDDIEHVSRGIDSLIRAVESSA